MPPMQTDPPPRSIVGNPATNPGALVGSNWVPGGIPTDKEESKKSFFHRDPLHIKPAVPPPKVTIPIPPLPHQGSNSGEGELAGGDPHRLRGVSTAPVRDTPVDHYQRDPSSNNVLRQEGSTPEVMRSTKGILRPSKLPRRDLKFSEKQCSLLDSQGHLVGHVHLTDIAKAERGSTSESGAAKWKEPDTPDFCSEGASAPVRKWLKIEGATYQHESAPGIHIGASLHDVLERDEDDDYETDGEEGNEDYDDCDEDTAKDEDNKEDDDDEDNTQFVDTNPDPPKRWTQSQQAQQDEQESSLVTEILLDDKRQQKSQMEAQKASKESASSSDGQPSSQGEGNEPFSEETDLQDEDETVMKEVAKLNTKNRVQMRALLEARDQCYAADKLCAQEVHGAILGLDRIPSVDQIHK